MNDIKDIYAINYVHNNIIYSLDMFRLKTYIDFDTFSSLHFYLRTFTNFGHIKKYWLDDRIKCFKYNLTIETKEGNTFYLGFRHNNEKSDEHEGKYNLTIEFNPNKIKDNPILLHILDLGFKWYIKSYDIAFDIRTGINNLIWDMSGRNIEKIDNRGFDNKTIMLGKGDGRVKIYNKKRESDLSITGELTRIEVSREVEDFPISDVKILHYDNNFPNVYMADYIYTFDDSKDKTTIALLYAIQNGFPLKDLTKTYRKKIKSMLEGGYKIKFNNNVVTDLLRQTIFHYFVRPGKSKQIIF